MIDGWMPARGPRAGSSMPSRRRLARVDVEGLQIPHVREGTVGIHARALGGASLPLSERFLLGATTPSQERLMMLIGIPSLLGPELAVRPCAPWAMATRSRWSTATIRPRSMRGG